MPPVAVGPQIHAPTAVPAVGEVQPAKVVAVAVAALHGFNWMEPVMPPPAVTVTIPALSVLIDATYLLVAVDDSQPQLPPAGSAPEPDV